MYALIKAVVRENTGREVTRRINFQDNERYILSHTRGCGTGIQEQLVRDWVKAREAQHGGKVELVSWDIEFHEKTPY